MPFNIVVPQLGESVVEGTIGKWLKKVGDPIAKDEPIVEIITDKINIELPAPIAGTLGRITVAEGVVAMVGQELGVILAPGETLGAETTAAPRTTPAAQAVAAASSATAAAPPATTHTPSTATPVSAEGRGISPAVRKLAKEHDLDLSLIRGSGMGGRVSREDVLSYIEAARLTPAAKGPMPAAAPAPLKAIPVPSFAAAGAREEEVQPLTNVRKKIAENMVRSRHTVAHCATWDEVDMTALVELRARMKDRIKTTYGVNLTYMPFIVKAVTRALKEYPVLNASMTESEVRYKKYYNIGVAVHRDAGLIVPVVKDADRKSVLQLAKEIEDLGNRTRADKLTLDDIQGGTFTITNAGMFGATASTPIINHPQVAILGVHLIQERAVVRDHRIVIRWMMTLVVSFDHRLVDGTPAVQFLHRVKELLEDPESWLLDSI